MVSGPCRVILILIIDELCEFINKTLKALLFDILTKTAVFIPDARPVFYVNMWHGTQLLKALCNTLRYEDIAMLLLCMLCVMLWVCYMCVMNVLWMCYECVMRVLWECYESVMKVLRKCYESVMDVLWMCEVCYGCVRYVMDVLRMYAWWMNDGYFITTV